MQRFNSKRFKQGAKKKSAPNARQIAQQLAQQNEKLEKQMRGLLEQIRQSGKSCLDRENTARYEGIGIITRLIRRINGEAPNPRFGTRKVQKKRKK